MSTDKVAIFWDFENCSAPTHCSGLDIVQRLRDALLVHGPIQQFRAYMSLSETAPSPKTVGLRSELQLAGVSLIDVPHNGRKNAVDLMMIVDMMAFCMDHNPPATLVLLTADRDFAYPVSTIRLRGFNVIVISPFGFNTHLSLKIPANQVLSWHNFLSHPNPSHKLSFEHRELSLHQRRVSEVTQTTSVQVPAVHLPKGPPSLPSTPRRQQNGAHLNDCLPLAPGPSFRAAPEIEISGYEQDDTPTTTLELLSEDSSLNTSEPNVGSPPLILSEVSPSEEDLDPATSIIETPAQSITQKFNTDVLPWYFKPLIDELTRCQSEAKPHPLRSAFAYDLKDKHPSLYRDAGVKGWSEYADLAEKRGIINLGGTGGKAWLTLSDRFRADPVFSLPASAALSTHAATHANSSMSSLLSASSASLALTTRVEAHENLSTSSFTPLVNVLARLQAEGQDRPARSAVALALGPSARQIYESAGVSSFKEYSHRAEAAGAVILGGVQASAWISLNQSARQDTGSASTSSDQDKKLPVHVNRLVPRMQSTPTRSLWVGSIPSSTKKVDLLSVFSVYGAIEGVRVLPPSNCGFVNFMNIEDAVQARKELDGRDLLNSEDGAIIVGFAKPPPSEDQDTPMSGLFQNMSMNTFTQIEPPSAVTNKTSNLNIHAQLIEVLNRFRLLGNRQPVRAVVGDALSASIQQIYSQTGLSNLQDYLKLAEKDGVVSLGDESAGSWVLLNAKFFASTKR